jgi:hypothetical protein
MFLIIFFLNIKMLEKLQLRKLREKRIGLAGVELDDLFSQPSSPSSDFIYSADGGSFHLGSSSQNTSLLCLSCESDEVYHEPLKSRGFTVYSVELLLFGLLAQRLFLQDADKIIC